MANVNVYEKFKLPSNDVNVIEIRDMIARALSKHFAIWGIRTNTEGIKLKSNLSGIFEHAVTKVDIIVRVENNYLLFKAEGTVGLGILSWLLCWIVPWFVIDVIRYMFSKDKPQQYIEAAFKSVGIPAKPTAVP